MNNDASSMTTESSVAWGLRRTPPCSQCRQRKVKCDKQWPCENCKKAGVDCSYQSAASTSAIETQSELQERIVQLEARLLAVTSLLPPVSKVDTSLGTTANQSPPELECHCGRQMIGTQFSVHFDYYMHWVELFPQLRDIYFQITVEEENQDGPKEVYRPILGGYPSNFTALHAYHPQEIEATLLQTVFFDNVDPFVRMLNKDAFFADLALFQKGKLIQSNNFTALLFSIYGLAVLSLEPTSILATFGVERDWLLNKYQEAQENALQQLDFINSNKLAVFQIFLYYLVFLFTRGHYRTATALLGLAARNAQRLGLHQDPSWFNYTQWVAEWRRRLWNQLVLLDQRAIALQGAITVLGFAWDTKLPDNINDKAWNTSPFAKPSDTPKPTGAFSQMTPILVKRQILKVLCPLRQNLRNQTYAEQMQRIQNGLQQADTFFTTVEDNMSPLAAFTNVCMKIEFEHLRLMAGQALVRWGEPPSQFTIENFVCALNLLERILSLETEAINTGWLWLFRLEPPLLATTIVLSHLSSVHDSQHAFRAWAVIDAIFEKYIAINGSSKPTILVSLESFRELARPTGLSNTQTVISTGVSDGPTLEEHMFDYFLSGGNITSGPSNSGGFPETFDFQHLSTGGAL